RMAQDIRAASQLLKGHTQLYALGYRAVLEIATPSDVVYLDPPYQGVCNQSDPRYLTPISHKQFIEILDDLNRRAIAFIVSYDGRTGTKSYGQALPESLDLQCL